MQKEQFKKDGYIVTVEQFRHCCAQTVTVQVYDGDEQISLIQWLVSYNTIVARRYSTYRECKPCDESVILFPKANYSSTTRQHVYKWLRTIGCKATSYSDFKQLVYMDSDYRVRNITKGDEVIEVHHYIVVNGCRYQLVKQADFGQYGRASDELNKHYEFLHHHINLLHFGR